MKLVYLIFVSYLHQRKVNFTSSIHILDFNTFINENYFYCPKQRVLAQKISFYLKHLLNLFTLTMGNINTKGRDGRKCTQQPLKNSSLFFNCNIMRILIKLRGKYLCSKCNILRFPSYCSSHDKYTDKSRDQHNPRANLFFTRCGAVTLRLVTQCYADSSAIVRLDAVSVEKFKAISSCQASDNEYGDRRQQFREKPRGREGHSRGRAR